MQGGFRKSIRRYLMQWFLGFALVMAASMIIGVIVLSEAAASGEAQRQLVRPIMEVREALYADGDKVKVKDGFQKPSEDFYYLVLDREGNVLFQELPEGIALKEFLKAARSERIMDKRYGNYYVRRRHVVIGKNPGRQAEETDVETRRKAISIVGLMERHHVVTVYLKIRAVMISVVVILTALLVLYGHFLGKWMTRPLLEMSENAKHLGENLDISMPMAYDGRFQEFQVLVEAYNRLQDKMQETIRRQKQFNSDVSHELRTPVAVVQAQCQLLLENEAMDPELCESVELISRQSRRMNELIRQLLMLSRFDQKAVRLEDEELELREMVLSVCDEMLDTLHQEVVFQYSLQDVHMNGNMEMIYTAIRNLVTNAVKYSEPGGRACVRIWEEEGAYISIEDEGRGMTEEETERIFDPFYRSEKSRSKEGFGLGLTLVQKIAEYYKGWIHVESTEGKGSVFTIFFPEKDDF